MELNLEDPFEFWIAQNYLDLTTSDIEHMRSAWVAALREAARVCEMPGFVTVINGYPLPKHGTPAECAEAIRALAEAKP